MIITLGSVVLLVLGIVILCFESCIRKWEDDCLTSFGIALVIVFAIATFVCPVIIAKAHSNVNKQIYEAKIERELIASQIKGKETEWAIIEKAVEWNDYVSSEKMLGNSLFTNWFFSKEYVDSLGYIEVEQ